MKEKIIEIVGFNMEPERAELIAQQVLDLFAVVGQSEQLHLCPVCGETSGKSYLLSRLPTICQKCDHAWNRA